MLYLILTASLSNHIASSASEDREARYQYAIRETLRHVPEGVQVIMVENTSRGQWSLKEVETIHTDHGHLRMRNKGVNECLDVLEVIQRKGMRDEDIVVKLTGRYRLLSSWLFDGVTRTADRYDVWMRFLNVATGEEDPSDGVMGCFAARVSALRYLSWSWMNLFDSPERALVAHLRSSVSSERVCAMEHLDVECVFAEDGRVLRV
jgi:hypothetical protein